MYKGHLGMQNGNLPSDRLDLKKSPYIGELATHIWISTMDSLIKKLDDLTSSGKNQYRAGVKFELVKHEVLRKAPGALLKATGKEELGALGELKKDIYREKRANMLVLYTSSFIDKFDLMHEIEFEEKFRVLHRRASTAEAISKDFFCYVIETVSAYDAAGYETALEGAELRLAAHELSNPIIAEMLRR